MTSPAVQAAGAAANPHHTADMRRVSLRVNGKPYSAEVESRTTLVDFLRHSLLLTGTHVGCEHGVCGACTILIDGRSARSCLTLAVQVEGCDITTIEGLANADGSLSILQQALSEKHGLQCGFCTPGMLMLMTELLRENPNPDRETIRARLNDNICRCTGYEDIISSVLRAAEILAQEKGAR